MNISKFTLVGRVAREPEGPKETQNGNVTNITVAVNRRVGGEDIASFFDIEGWDKTSEHLANFEKGQLGYFEGELFIDVFPAKDKAGNEIMTDEGKRVMRRITKLKCYGSRYGAKANMQTEAPHSETPTTAKERVEKGRAASKSRAGPKGKKGQEGTAGEEDVPF